MSEIPKSEWTIKRVYFKAQPISDFSRQYIQWLESQGESPDSYDTLDAFLKNISSQDIIDLYQFPTADKDGHYDYFEKNDDNHVIPRSLFLIMDKLDDR
jgi:hypothetical protein